MRRDLLNLYREHRRERTVTDLLRGPKTGPHGRRASDRARSRLGKGRGIMDRNVFGVAILGQSGVGKSSLIKRMVSHRFDNMPTLNEQFMGNKLDGRHVMAITMPAPFTAASAKGASRQVLLQIEDQLGDSGPDALIDRCLANLWKDVARANASAGSAAEGRGSSLGGPLGDVDDEMEDPTEQWGKTPSAAVANLPPANSRLPDPPKRHPFSESVLEQQRRDAMRPAINDAGVTSALSVPSGMHGFVVVIDLGDPHSLHAAERLCEKLLTRVKFDRMRRQPCPIIIMLVGNKCDRWSRGRRHDEVDMRSVWRLLEHGIASGLILSQMRRQRVDTVLRKLCDDVIKTHKAAEAAAKMSAFFSVAGSVSRFTQETGMSEQEYLLVEKLHAALDPIRGMSVHMGEAALLHAIYTLLNTPYFDAGCMPPTEIWERIMACPCITIKYIELSCKTNHNVHSFERVLMRALRQLVTNDRKGVNRAVEGSIPFMTHVGSFLSSTFAQLNPEQCAKARKPKEEPALAAR